MGLCSSVLDFDGTSSFDVPCSADLSGTTSKNLAIFRGFEKRWHPSARKSEKLKMGVSENRGTPKSSIFIGISIINHPFWGIPIFGNTQMHETPLATFPQKIGWDTKPPHENVTNVIFCCYIISDEDGKAVLKHHQKKTKNISLSPVKLKHWPEHIQEKDDFGLILPSLKLTYALAPEKWMVGRLSPFLFGENTYIFSGANLLAVSFRLVSVLKSCCDLAGLLGPIGFHQRFRWISLWGSASPTRKRIDAMLLRTMPICWSHTNDEMSRRWGWRGNGSGALPKRGEGFRSSKKWSTWKFRRWTP